MMYLLIVFGCLFSFCFGALYVYFACAEDEEFYIKFRARVSAFKKELKERERK